MSWHLLEHTHFCYFEPNINRKDCQLLNNLQPYRQDHCETVHSRCHGIFTSCTNQSVIRTEKCHQKVFFYHYINVKYGECVLHVRLHALCYQDGKLVQMKTVKVNFRMG